jgi:tungstate transport system ATP-binding protein
VSEPIYRIDQVVHRYQREPVLAIDRLDIEPASIVGLVGPNGSGKSTLLKLMAFILRPSEGQIRFNGQPASPFDASVRFKVTLLTQDPYLMKRSVFKNIVYGLKVRGDRGNWARSVNDALTMVGLDPVAFSKRYWDELSGGEAQRVALAARLVLRPQVLLLDEPTASVDAASSELIRSASLRARDEWGTTLVVSSHDSEWLYDVSDEVLHLFKGRPVGRGRFNMIFGPWIDDGSGRWSKNLGDDRRLRVSPPPDADATAFIDPSDFRILGKDASAEAGTTATVSGMLIRLSLDRRGGDLFADVRVGTITLAVRVLESHLAAITLHRGWPVTIAYRLDRIRWR